MTRDISNSIAKAFAPVTELFFDVSGKLKNEYLVLMEKFGVALSKVVKWITNPQTIAKAGNFFNNIKNKIM
jgi:hypothetical protein